MNKNKKIDQRKFFFAVIILLLFLFGIYTYFGNERNCSESSLARINIQEQEAGIMTEAPSQTYQLLSFNFQNNVSWLTKKQLNEHETLYKGYVQKRNEITQKLQTLDLSTANGNRTFSEYRSLKIAETYAVNGMLLHELYFENLGSSSQDIGPEMQKLIIENFGSIARFKKDFFLSATSARGWVMVAFGLDDSKLHTYVLEEHNQHVPVLALPLLVLDVYEHAYMIDFGIARDPYVEQFWNTINWSVVEERIEKWVKKFYDK